MEKRRINPEKEKTKESITETLQTFKKFGKKYARINNEGTTMIELSEESNGFPLDLNSPDDEKALAEYIADWFEAGYGYDNIFDKETLSIINN
jgi:hypothetical protein